MVGSSSALWSPPLRFWQTRHSTPLRGICLRSSALNARNLQKITKNANSCALSGARRLACLAVQLWLLVVVCSETTPNRTVPNHFRTITRTITNRPEPLSNHRPNHPEPSRTAPEPSRTAFEPPAEPSRTIPNRFRTTNRTTPKHKQTAPELQVHQPRACEPRPRNHARRLPQVCSKPSQRWSSGAARVNGGGNQDRCPRMAHIGQRRCVLGAKYGKLAQKTPTTVAVVCSLGNWQPFADSETSQLWDFEHVCLKRPDHVSKAVCS